MPPVDVSQTCSFLADPMGAKLTGSICWRQELHFQTGAHYQTHHVTFVTQSCNRIPFHYRFQLSSDFQGLEQIRVISAPTGGVS